MSDTDNIIHCDATEILFDATLHAAAAKSAPSFPVGKDIVLSLVLPDGQRVNLPVLDAAVSDTPRAPISIPESWSCSFTLEPESRRALDKAFRRFSVITYATRAPTPARKPAPPPRHSRSATISMSAA
jgi:hypothetical protein